MPKVITEEKTVYRYEELSDDAKRNVVDRYLDDVIFASWGRERESDAEEELKEMGEELLKNSKFKHAEVDDVYYDFSYSQGSGAVLEFNYPDNNLALDFPEIMEDLINMFTDDPNYANSYYLEKKEIDEIFKLLKTKDLNALFDINFSVYHTGRYANWETDYNVDCHANQEIKYCLERLMDDWIYKNLHNSELVDEIEGEFSSKAYEWYDKMSNPDNYSNDAFQDWFYENGEFACLLDEYE